MSTLEPEISPVSSSASDNEPRPKALIYCRVSGKKQTKDGSGLNSQEHRCRQYAEAKNYDVVEVFSDDVTGGGDFIKRKGMVRLLAYMDAYPDENFVVIFDDLKRYARDAEFHLKLRRVIAARGATRECLNYTFENTPEGRFSETINAAHNELEREQNARQTKQKIKARLEQGWWTFSCPIGYEYVKAEGGGRKLVLDPKIAPIVKAGLEGYANGRFASQNEVRLFFESQPDFPKNKHGKVYKQSIPRLLRKDLYAGLLHSDEHKVSQRKAKHEALISVQVYQRIQAKLTEGVYAPMRKDISVDFPLRGAVACSSCGKPLTAGWCQGKTKKYPYYFCQNRKCGQYSRTIPRDKLHGEFETLLALLKPEEGYGRVFIEMFKMQWEDRVKRSHEVAKGFAREAQKVERKINDVLDKMLAVSNPRVIESFERRIDDLERQKLIALEKSDNAGQPVIQKQDLLKHAFAFLLSPCKLWDSGHLALQKMTLRLAFAGPLNYDRNTGCLNTTLSLPFRALGKNFGGELKMVPLG